MRDIYKYGKEYKELPFEKYQVKYRRKKVLELLKKYKHKSVLEIGCGEEPLFMHEDSVVNWVVVEPNKEFFQKAEMLSGSNAKCINNTLENAVDEIKQMNIEFEYIICSSLLHEVEDKSQLLNAIKKLCSTDTIIHINVPNAKSLHRIIAYEMGIVDNIYKKSETQEKMQQSDIVYDYEKLSKYVEKFGFEIIENGSYFIKPLTHKQMQQCFDKNIFDEKILSGFYGLAKYLPEFGSEIYIQAKIKR